MNWSWPETRSLFFSDLHLGWKFADPTWATRVLANSTPKFVYLVGDTFEWLHGARDAHSFGQIEFLAAIEEAQSRGAVVNVVPGNHDYHLADYGQHSWIIRPSFIHESADARRFFVAHGDVFDLHMPPENDRHGGIGRRLGRWAYPRLVRWGDSLHRLGFDPKSRSSHWCTTWKLSSQKARLHIAAFKSFMSELALAHVCDGVICGHIHLPDESRVGHVDYFNCGDWIEHRSFVVEDRSGQMRLVRDASQLCFHESVA